MFRTGRSESVGGGVLMYVHQDLPDTPILEMIDLVI